MKCIIGLDIGGSITKIVGFDGARLIGTVKVKAEDQITSAYGAFGRFISETGLDIEDIAAVAVTGVGASFLKGGFYGVPLQKINEFDAVGEGGRYISGLSDAIVVSMGTGTAFIKISENSTVHLGGSGVGGGTIQGLAGKILGVRKFQNILQLAEKGSLDNVDLTVGDISSDEIPNMTKDVTASNFGKISDLATNEDMALGIMNMVFQTIGMMAIFAAKEDGIKDIILTGNLASIPFAKGIFEMLENLHGVRFLLPTNAEFATAIGAALCLSKQKFSKKDA